MYAVIYQVTPEALERWAGSNCTALRNCVAPERCGGVAQPLRSTSGCDAPSFRPEVGQLLGLYQELDCLDILKNLLPNVAFWVDYDLIPSELSVGAVE